MSEFNRLPNGAHVIDQHGDIVLCRFRNEFVTWMVASDGEAYWGHYFPDFDSAVDDYRKRRTHPDAPNNTGTPEPKDRANDLLERDAWRDRYMAAMVGLKDYPLVRVWCKQMGSLPYYVAEQVARALADNAPPDAIYKGDTGVWRTVDGIVDVRRQSYIYELSCGLLGVLDE